MRRIVGTLERRIPHLESEDGATAIEYALLASLIAAAIAVTVALVGDEVVDLFQTLVDSFI